MLQGGFFWFTSDPTINLVISTGIVFLLMLLCSNSRAKNRDLTILEYLGMLLFSLGIGFYLVAGIYAVVLVAPLSLIGIALMILGEKTAVPDGSSD